MLYEVITILAALGVHDHRATLASEGPAVGGGSVAFVVLVQPAAAPVTDQQPPLRVEAQGRRGEIGRRLLSYNFV